MPISLARQALSHEQGPQAQFQLGSIGEGTPQADQGKRGKAAGDNSQGQQGRALT